MIAADSSSLIAFLGGGDGEDMARLDQAFQDGSLVLPPPVITELLAGTEPADGLDRLLGRCELLPVLPGYWERAGLNRRRLLERGLRARIADALIAQACIDSDVALLARDRDYRHFERWCGLKLA